MHLPKNQVMSKCSRMTRMPHVLHLRLKDREELWRGSWQSVVRRVRTSSLPSRVR